jgi:heat shock protein HslJ
MRGMLMAVMAAGVLALAGCGEEQAPPADDVVGASPPAGTYVVTGITDGGQPRALVPGSQVRISFTDGNLGLQAGCNSMSGTFQLDDGTLKVGPMGGTEMGCPEPLMAQDTWLAGLFGVPVKVGTDPLTLTSGDVVLTLVDRETASPDLPLVGTRWVLDGLIQGDSASSVPGTLTAEITLPEKGEVVLDTGCNSGSGAVVAGEGTLSFGQLMLTKKACTKDNGSVEGAFQSVLDGETTYEIEEHSLTIMKGDQGLMFRGEVAAPVG